MEQARKCERCACKGVPCKLATCELKSANYEYAEKLDVNIRHANGLLRMVKHASIVLPEQSICETSHEQQTRDNTGEC